MLFPNVVAGCRAQYSPISGFGTSDSSLSLSLKNPQKTKLKDRNYSGAIAFYGWVDRSMSTNGCLGRSEHLVTTINLPHLFYIEDNGSLAFIS